MSSKLTSYILYIVFGLSVLVALFYYASPATLDYDALEAKVKSLQTAEVEQPAAVATDTVVSDTTATDTAATDSTALAQMPPTDNTGEAPVEEVNLKEELSGWEYLVYFRTDIALIWAYILFVVAALTAVVLPLISVATNTKSLLRLGAVLAAAAVIILISYALSSDTPIDIIGYEKFDNRDPVTLRMVDTGLFTTYALFGITLLTILYSEISKIFK